MYKYLYGITIFLEREAGYSVVCLALIAAGVTLVDNQTRPQVAHDLIIFATGVLARSMGQKKTQTATTNEDTAASK